MPWRPGQSGNPSGRPRSAFSAAKRILEETNNGDDILAVFLRMLRGEEVSPQSVQGATWLADRAWGKPMQSVELAASIETTTPGLDTRAVIARLDVEALRALVSAIDAAMGEGQAAPPAIDVAPVPALPAANEGPAADSCGSQAEQPDSAAPDTTWADSDLIPTS